jgi:endonuclease G, mitochondrial
MIDLDKLVQASENRMPAEVNASIRGKQAPRPASDSGLAFGLTTSLEGFVQPPPTAEEAPPPPPTFDPDFRSRVDNLTFGGAKPSTTELERLIGNNDLVDEFYLQRALVAARPVMRIVLRDEAGRERGWATGFMVSPGLLLTNHHVFPSLEETENAVVEANYVLDIAGNPAPSYRFAVQGKRFYYALQELDFSLVAVEPTSQDGRTALSTFGFHRLSRQAQKIRENESMTLIQHPGGERRQLAIRENRLVKITDSYLWYLSDTAQGSSGAPAFNDSFQVVALHHSGAAKRDEATGQYVLKDGRKVDSLKDVPESQVVWVANEGIRISALCEHLATTGDLDQANPFIRELFGAMQGGDIITSALKGRIDLTSLTATEGAPAPIPPVPIVPVSLPSAGAVLTIPLQLNIQLSLGGASIPPLATVGQTGAAVPALTSPTAVEESALEALSRINLDRDYENRTGYDPAFLGVQAPLPEVTDESLVSHMGDGAYMLPYEHFSVVVNKKRRLPLFTAINIDYSEAQRHPEPGKYGRNDLTGTSNEVWFTDPRIPQQDQLPDRFYNADGGVFDKGHVVRREDACWGESYAQVARGNCDTFHVTNCTPQVAGFNRSNRGVDDWGDLENEVQKQAKAERLCVFAGPILSSQDKSFNGKDDFGPVKIQIPKEFWKVVLANNRGKLEAFAFILKQDLTSVPLEFAVTAAWAPFQVAITELEGLLKGFRFPQAIRDADQFKKTGRKTSAPRKKKALSQK